MQNIKRKRYENVSAHVQSFSKATLKISQKAKYLTLC